MLRPPLGPFLARVGMRRITDATGRLALATLLMLTAALPAAYAEGIVTHRAPLPPGTRIHRGSLPTVRPSVRTTEGRRAWCRDATRLAATTRDGALAAALRFAAAWEQTHGGLTRPGQTPPPARWDAVVQAVAVGHPLHAAARLEAARAWSHVGHPERAAVHLDVLARMDPRPSIGATPGEVLLSETVARHRTRYEAALRGSVHTALGRHADAARAYTRAAEQGTHDPARAWGDAARAHVRAAQPAAARAAAQRAASGASSARDAMAWRLWSVCLDHDALGPTGEPRRTGTWPGPAFADALLHTLADALPGTTASALEMGTMAIGCEAHADALSIYEQALTSPHLDEDLRQEPLLARGLLVAIPAAIRAGQPTRGDAVLRAIEPYLDDAPRLVAELRIRLKHARADLGVSHVEEPERRPARGKTASSEAPTRETDADGVEARSIAADAVPEETSADTASGTPTATDTQPTEAQPTDRNSLWLLWIALLVTSLGAVLWRAYASRRAPS